MHSPSPAYGEPSIWYLDGPGSWLGTAGRVPADLAASLNNQSVFLSDLGWREGVMAAIEEAVTVYQELAGLRPAVFCRYVTQTRWTLGHRSCPPLDVQQRRKQYVTRQQPCAGLNDPLAMLPLSAHYSRSTSR